MMKKKKTLSLSKISIASLSNSSQIRGGDNFNTETCMACTNGGLETDDCNGGNANTDTCDPSLTVTTTINGHTVGCTPPPPTGDCLNTNTIPGSL